MTNDEAFTFIMCGMLIAAMAAILICCFWDWYASFWGRRLDKLECLQFLAASSVYTLVTIGTLAWIAAFVGIIVNAMYKIVL